LPIALTLTGGQAAGENVVLDFNLAPLAPGDYIFELNAGRGSLNTRKLIAIRIINWGLGTAVYRPSATAAMPPMTPSIAIRALTNIPTSQ
jgi:hypothetical protein